MLAQSIFEYSNGQFSISLDHLSWGQLGIVALCVNFVYGFVTHFHSTIQVRKWHRSQDVLSIQPFGLVMVLFCRLFFGLSWRILCVPFGLIGFAASLQNNQAMKSAWRWHLSPKGVWDEVPPGLRN